MAEVTRPRLVAVDLFSGAGGFSLGFEQAGFDADLAVEYDPVHAATYGFNFPDTRMLCEDIRRVDWDRTKHNQITRPIDVVFGGAPCQGFSDVGLRDILD